MFRIIVLVVAFCLMGCSGIHWKYDPSTEAYEVRYWRLGNQELHGFKVIKKPDGTRITLDSQKATDESLQEILRIIRQISGAMP